MALQDGDVVRFDYTLWVDGSSKPLDTSIEAQAQELGMHDPEKTYQPLTVTLGAHQIIPGLESHIRSHGKKGTEVVAELEPEDAYGPRDAHKIRDVPMAQFKKEGVKPEVGLVLNLKGERGVITRVAGGRVRVDTNHHLAGKKLRYGYKILQVLSEPKEKVEAVLSNLFPRQVPSYTHAKDVITLEVPEEARFDREWTMHKLRLVAELRSAAGMGTTVKLVETFEGRKPEPEEGATAKADKGAKSPPGAKAAKSAKSATPAKETPEATPAAQGSTE